MTTWTVIALILTLGLLAAIFLPRVLLRLLGCGVRSPD